MTRVIPGVLAAATVMLGGFWLADRIGQAILAAQGLSGGSPLSGVPVAIVLGLIVRNLVPLPEALTPGLRFATGTLLRLRAFDDVEQLVRARRDRGRRLGRRRAFEALGVRTS